MSGQLSIDRAPANQPGAPASESVARWRRCKALSPVQHGEAERLISDFLTSRSITLCPTRYAAPVEQRSHVVHSRH